MAGLNRKEVSGQLQERTKESFDNRKDSSRFGSYFKANGEIDFRRWACSEGDHTFDIVPFIAKHDYPPPSKIKEGKLAYKVDLYVHTNIGPNDDIFVCPLMFNHSRCAICEEKKRLLDAGNPWEKVKHLSPQRRTIYNIIVYDNDDEIDKGLQIWDPAFWNMEEHLLRISKNPRTGGLVAFADPWEGRYICFNRTGTKKDNTRYTGHALYERDYQIDEEFVEAAIDPLQIIHIPDYNELYEAYFGEPAPAPQAHRPAAASPRGPAASRGEDDVPNEVDDPSAAKPRPAGPRPAGRPGPAAAVTAKPGAARPRPASPAARPAPHEEEAAAPDQTDGDDPGPAGDEQCPGGGVFGQDIDKLGACPSCEVWNECARANELKPAEEAPPAQKKPAGPAAVSGSKLRRPPRA